MTPAIRSAQDVLEARYQSTADWSEQHIVLREGASRGRLHLYAWQREILDAYDDLNVRRIVMMMASRSGKTAVLLCILGAGIAKNPQPMLFGHPTMVVRKQFYQGKLIPMIESSAELNSLVDRTNQNNIPLDLMVYPGGPLYSQVSGSKNAFASVGVQTAVADELDKFAFNLDTGNPVDALEQRVENYQTMSKLVLASTPAIAAVSLINSEFLAISQGRWHVPCPHCDAPWIMSADQINNDRLWHTCSNKKFETMHYCGAQVSERERMKVLPEGHFYELNPNPRLKSYHLERIQSPASSLAGIIDSKNRAENEPEHRVVYFTNVKAVPYTPRLSEEIEPHVLDAAFTKEQPPKPVTAITMAVDVQKDRLEYKVQAWIKLQPWTLIHARIEDYADKDEKWRRLNRVINSWMPDAIAIDRKYNQKEVREMCDKYLKYWLDCNKLWLIKGYEHPSFGDNVIRNVPTARYPHDLTLSVDEAKCHVRDIIEGIQYKVAGPVLADYNAQLLSETLIETPNRASVNKQWVKDPKVPNEAFDLFVYNYAMRVHIGYDYQRISSEEYLESIDEYLETMGV